MKQQLLVALKTSSQFLQQLNSTHPPQTHHLIINCLTKLRRQNCHHYSISHLIPQTLDCQFHQLLHREGKSSITSHQKPKLEINVLCSARSNPYEQQHFKPHRFSNKGSHGRPWTVDGRPSAPTGLPAIPDGRSSPRTDDRWS